MSTGDKNSEKTDTVTVIENNNNQNQNQTGGNSNQTQLASAFMGTMGILSGLGRTLTGIGQVANNYISTTRETGRGLEQMSHGKLIELADLVHDVFQGDELLEPPSICTIGSQSAGKSMALNSICGIDILPNGKSIVTRTPVHIRLMHGFGMDHIKVEFFEYSNSVTNINGLGSTDSIQKTLSSFKVDLSCPSDQLQPIREEIEKITEKYAGKGKNVVDKPINIRITSPKVPNLSIIDLPGMTNIALRDKGQPENIKQNIERILTKYISSPRTIILAIIPSTFDVEADMGLGLIKQYDKNFDRTIGVLTKTDLLTDSDVERYLTNSISKDLQVKYGYFAVRNRSSDEVRNHTVEDGYLLESNFFSSHPVYSKSEAKDRMGSINLANRLSEILISHLKACLPSVIEEIRKFDRNLDAKLDEIGRDYPHDSEAKRSVMNILISEFQKTYDQSITGRGSEYNTGAQIKKAINSMKKNCQDLNPFSPDIYTDRKIREIIEDYDGIHMTSSAISTGIIETLFQGTDELHPYASEDSLTHPSLGDSDRSRRNSGNIDPFINMNMYTGTKNRESELDPDLDSDLGTELDYETDSDSYAYNNTYNNTHKTNNDHRNASNVKTDIRRCDPLTVLINPYRSCMKDVQKSLIDLASNILMKERFSRFPKLCDRIKDIVSNSIISRRYHEVIADIEKRIIAEKRCIWTDDVDFNTKILPYVSTGSNNNSNNSNNNSNNSNNNSSQKSGKNTSQRGEIRGEMRSDYFVNPESIRRVLYEYFKIIRSDITTFIHKQVIAYFVIEVVSDVNTGLNDKILSKTSIDVLLEENKDKAAKRAELYSLKKKIDMIKIMIDNCSV